MARYKGFFGILFLGSMLLAVDVLAGNTVQQQPYQQTRDVEQRALPRDMEQRVLSPDVEQRALSARTSRESSSSDGSAFNTFGYLLLAGFLGVLGFVGYEFYPAWNQRGGLAVQSQPSFRPAERAHGVPSAAADVPGSVFISYRRDDSADITGRIYDRLIQRFSRDIVFKDVDSIPLGIDFRQHLEKALSQCRVLIAVVGDEWTGSEQGKRRIDDPRDHVRLELELALNRNIPVIPVLVRNATIPAEEALPSSLRSLAYRNGIQVRPDPDFHADVDRLIKGIEPHVNR
jgi:hypothetical protein